MSDRMNDRMTGRVGRHPVARRGPADVRYAPPDRPARERAAQPATPPTPASTATPAATPDRARRGLLRWRRANRRITVETRSPAVWVGERLAALGRRLLIVGKVLAALVVLAAAIAGGRLAIRHVVQSPRFAVREFRVAPTHHVSREDVIDRTGIALGSRLLAVDTDQIAARLTRHPWIASARVRRELPATLVIDVTERRAGAVAVIGGLYLIDEKGHPFKHATLEEADGQLVITGISRAEYAGLPHASESAFREALALYAQYQNQGDPTSVQRPPLSEIHIDPRTGFTLLLYEGGGEIRLGKGGIPDKLQRFDQILGELGPRGVSALRVVHLDGAAGDRVPIRLAQPTAGDQAAPPAARGGPGQ